MKLAGPRAEDIATRLRVVHDWLGPLADFSDACQEDVAVFASAARAALHEPAAEDGAGWHEPSFFPGYMERFRELVALLDEWVGPPAEAGA